jgi:predicted trehalose synthase
MPENQQTPENEEQATLAMRSRKLGARVRVIRAVTAECRALRVEGRAFETAEEALAVVVARLEKPQGEAKELLAGMDFETLLEWVDKMMPYLLLLVRIFLIFI